MIKTEQDYINAILNGDMDGLDDIYTTYLPRITAFIRSKGGNAEDAQDVFQDALMIIYEKCRQANFTIETKFYYYLLTICRNLWGNRIKKKSFKEVTLPEHTTHTSDDDIEQLIFQEEEEKVFWSAFAKLGADCQKVLQLFFKKVKMEKIMEVMGFSSVNYTKKRKHNCKNKLVDLVKGDARYLELHGS